MCTAHAESADALLQREQRLVDLGSLHACAQSVIQSVILATRRYYLYRESILTGLPVGGGGVGATLVAGEIDE